MASTQEELVNVARREKGPDGANIAVLSAPYPAKGSLVLPKVVKWDRRERHSHAMTC